MLAFTPGIYKACVKTQITARNALTDEEHPVSDEQ